MHISVKLFATLTRYKEGAKAGTPFEFDLCEDAKVLDILNTLHIPLEEAHVIFINNMIVDLDTSLKNDDVVGI
ncbi:MAG: MoaD/ThiS family protein, partial [Leptolinea sp.]|nr:MoaD/ThiS family protein [Leptolinea sp.]